MNKIKDVYIIHHSHTDIGYTDLQETVIFHQIHHIRKAMEIIEKGYAENSAEKDFRWNCETYFCVERFLENAGEEERARFFDLVKKGNIGLSANYLNFNDLVDCEMLGRRLDSMKEFLAGQDVQVKTAMNADINGISMGHRDALLDCGVEFLFTNIHCHHGMYPLYQNQTPYFWEAADGRRLLVWNGEHYNLGNALGLVYNRNVNFMTENYFGKAKGEDPLEELHKKLGDSIREYEENGYPYDFYITSVSGVFSDNAPPNPNIIHTVCQFNERYGEEVQLHMVTLEQLYERIKDSLKDAPVYQGDLNDWWANGVGSTPYSVKLYKEALRFHHISDRLEEHTGFAQEDLKRQAEERLFLYAEHTWGHSASITNPYDTMVLNLDTRNTSYASAGHELGAMRKKEQCRRLGDVLSYYSLNGQVKAISFSGKAGYFPVEFYVETMTMPGAVITDLKTGEQPKIQLSPHPRGVLISFVSWFEPREEKVFSYRESVPAVQGQFTRTAYVGAERVRDIVNTYDAETYRLPYEIENPWFKIRYRVGEGILSFFNKKTGTEMLPEGEIPFFTPIYEETEIRTDVYEERRLLGRNIRGLHAKASAGKLKDVRVLEQGDVFVSIELEFALPGTDFCSVILKMYRELPKVEFRLKTAKQLSSSIESLYLPLTLKLPDTELYIHKGGVPMRPGIDQLPGTCMEYYIADEGLLFRGEEGSMLVQTLDTSLIYQGEMRHHPICLCDRRPENNQRPVYSWIMNNTWETNFQIDLSGYGEFCYSVEFVQGNSLEEDLRRLKENDMGIETFITAQE